MARALRIGVWPLALVAILSGGCGDPAAIESRGDADQDRPRHEDGAPAPGHAPPAIDAAPRDAQPLFDAAARDTSPPIDGASRDAPPPDGATANLPPQASAGRGQLAAVGLAVRLDGRDSRDPDGDPLRFRWTLVGKPDGSQAALAEAASARPTLEPDRAGSYQVTLVVSDGRADSAADAVTIEVRPAGPFVPFFVGSGTIPDVLRGGTLELTQDRRVHVLLLPEGYTAVDLPAYDDDVQRWFDDWSRVEPYAGFREAFVIWKLPQPSGQRLTSTSPQAADTAFRLPLDASGELLRIATDGETARRVWDALGAFPFAPDTYFGAGGRTAYLAKGVVVSMLVLDPATGRSGFSGFATHLTSPDEPSRRVAVAVARDTTHEFTHAFARLADEYIQSGNTGSDEARMTQSAYLSNVTVGRSCDRLPWRHLLDGSMLNPQRQGLVGAFGTAEVGYHPELLCLMNGTHQNAEIYGGDGRLRTRDRMCNWCREVAALRLHERTQLLPDQESSLDTWTGGYRAPFYQRFGFHVPATVPQTNSAGQPWYQACAP